MGLIDVSQIFFAACIPFMFRATLRNPTHRKVRDEWGTRLQVHSSLLNVVLHD
jgi:hypothetical protein